MYRSLVDLMSFIETRMKQICSKVYIDFPLNNIEFSLVLNKKSLFEILQID